MNAKQPVHPAWEDGISFSGDRFTSANGWIAAASGLGLTVGWYGALKLVQTSLPSLAFATDLFLRPGNLPTVVPTTFLFFVSVVILFIKNRKIARQRQAFEWGVVPAQADFILTETSAKGVLERIHAAGVRPRNFVLMNQIERALTNLHNLGQVSEVSSVLRGQAEDDENEIAESFTLLNGFVWAMPVLGFIGTVQGLSQAVGGFGAVLESAQNLDAIRGALGGVTAGLATAFETTLVALVFSLVVQLWITFQRRGEFRFLNDCSEYCQAHIISKLRMKVSE